MKEDMIRISIEIIQSNDHYKVTKNDLDGLIGKKLIGNYYQIINKSSNVTWIHTDLIN